MWDEADVKDAIKTYPAQSARALAAMQFGRTDPLTPDAFGAAAAILHCEIEDLWVDQLRDRELLASFAEALRAQGVALDTPPPFADHVNEKALGIFAPKAKAFRCRIFVNGEFAGTGCLLGPSTVLTAWHVIAVARPRDPQEPAPKLKVQLSDGTEQIIAPELIYKSCCGDDEYDHVAPRRDDRVLDRYDVAVLKMRHPAGAHLGFAPLPPQAAVPNGKRTLFLAHFPEGVDEYLGIGRISKIRGMTARVRHDIQTLPGSSGGACFDGDLLLAGIHQGRFQDDRRLVPCRTWIDTVRPDIEQDRAPTRIWSLDRTDSGPLVIGRDLFFETIAAAGRLDTAVRGIRLKRLDIATGVTGLAFSYDILGQMLARGGAGHFLVRIPFDALVDDFDADIRRRTGAAGLLLADAVASPGVVSGQAASEGATRASAAVLCGAINAAATESGRIIWYFMDNPSVAVSEPVRLAFEAFVAAALAQPRIRLVLAGFETMPLPGPEFASPGVASDGSPPGLVVEFLGGFTKADILNFLTVACQDLCITPDLAVIDNTADLALDGLQPFNGVFQASDLKTVADRLRPQLKLWLARGGQP